jgi:hypothetical protein
MPTVAFRATRSRRKFVKAPEVKRKLQDVLTDPVKKHFVKEFDGVVSDWDHKPEFKARAFIASDYIKVNVYPAGSHKKIWEYVSRGTRPHLIPKSGPGMLAFMLGYSARTKPRGKAHVGSGTASGPKVVGVMQVHHPGNEAREFEEVIAEENKAWYSREMNNAWRRIIRSL